MSYRYTDTATRLAYSATRGTSNQEGKIVKFWADAAGTVPIDVGLWSANTPDTAGASTGTNQLTVQADSMWPAMWDRTGALDHMWIQAGTANNPGDLYLVYCDPDQRLDAHDTRLAAIEAGGSGDTLLLHKAGAEAITGVKTFSAEPVVPTPTVGTSPTTKTYVDAADAAVTTAAATDATTKVAAEATTRAAADTTLSGLITTEATSRAAADTTLSGSITTEATARAAADALLTPLARTISTTAPLTGGGSLSADRTLAVSNATGSTVGVIQLAGDLAGSATAPTIAAGAVNSAKIADGTIVDGDVSSSAQFRVSAAALGLYSPLDPAFGYTSGTDLAASGQAAINAMPTSGTYFGGNLVCPPGNWTVSTAWVLKSGVRVSGSGRMASRLTGTAAGVFTWTANFHDFVIENLRLVSSAGHVFAPTGDFGMYTGKVKQCDISVTDVNSSILNHVSSKDYDNVTWEECYFTRLAGATVPGFNIINSGGAANENRWRDCWAHSNNCTSTPMFLIESTALASYAYDNVFENITGEQNRGGLVELRNNYGGRLTNVVDWDAVGDYAADLIKIGSSASAPSLRSSYITLTNVGRRGGTLGAGLYDINLVAGQTSRCTVIAPNHSSSGLRINFSSSDGHTILGAPTSSAWTGQLTGSGSYWGGLPQFGAGLYVGTGAQINAGTGSPNGVVSGNPGDVWIRTDGGASTTFYVKESGTGTTSGWTAYGTDANAVHITGTETVTGSKTFTSNVAVSSSLANILSANQAVPTTAAWNNQNAATLSNSSTFLINGTNTLKIRSSNGTANPIAAGIGTVTNTLTQIPVNASTQYTAVVSFLAETTARSCSLSIKTYDAGGSVVRTLSATVTDNTVTPTQAAVTFTTSSSEVAVGVLCQISGTPPTSENHYIGQAQIILGTSTTWLTPGTTPSAALSPTGFATANGALALASSGTSGVTVNAASGTGTGGLIVGDGAGNNVLSAAGTGVYVQGLIRKRTAVADAAYTVLTSDGTVAYTSLTAARVVNLPAQGATLPIGREFTIKDESGSCDGTKTLTITPPSGTIDGAATLVLNTAYAKATVYTNGTNWFTR